LGLALEDLPLALGGLPLALKDLGLALRGLPLALGGEPQVLGGERQVLKGETRRQELRELKGSQPGRLATGGPLRREAVDLGGQGGALGG